MIPVLDAAGSARASRPTWSASAAPTSRRSATDYTYARHVEWMRAALFDALDLRDVTLVGQDWGGLVGLRLVGEHPDRFARVVAANTFLPTGDTPPGDAFLAWQRFSQTVEDFPVGFIVNSGCTTDLAEDVVAAYDAPFPDEHVQGRRAPVPDAGADQPRRSGGRGEPRGVGDAARVRPKPFLTAFSDKDPITRGGDRVFQRDVPGCAGQPHTTIAGGGHFLQEDRGEELAAGRRRVRDGLTAWPISSRCSTRSARSRGPACTTARTRSIVSATNGCSSSRRAGVRRPHRRSTATEIRARFARRDRLRDREGRRRRRRVRRRRPRPAGPARRRRQVGAGRGLGRPERVARGDGRARARRRGSASSARVDRLVGVVLPPANAGVRPHGVRLGRLPLLDRRRHASARSPTKCSRSRGSDVDDRARDWHHPPRDSSRAPRSKRTGACAPASEPRTSVGRRLVAAARARRRDRSRRLRARVARLASWRSLRPVDEVRAHTRDVGRRRFAQPLPCRPSVSTAFEPRRSVGHCWRSTSPALHQAVDRAG